jgi:hypothetical protein
MSPGIGLQTPATSPRKRQNVMKKLFGEEQSVTPVINVGSNEQRLQPLQKQLL